MSAFNKTGICWCDYTFNPLTGGWGPQGTRERPNWCPWCYAKKLAVTRLKDIYPFGFEPTVHLDRFEQEPPSGQHRIFVCSMGDPCGDWDWKQKYEGGYTVNPPELVQARLWRYIEAHPQHQFILLTKNPAGLKRPTAEITDEDSPLIPPGSVGTGYYGGLPSNLIWGISLTGSDEANMERLETFNRVRRPEEKIVISYEPALSPLPELPTVEPGMGWLIIGAQTGPGAEEPDLAEIGRAIHNAQVLGWRVWVKDNVIAQFPRHTLQREPWPREQLSLPAVPRPRQLPPLDENNGPVVDGLTGLFGF